jgi:hypothetical protein
VPPTDTPTSTPTSTPTKTPTKTPTATKTPALEGCTPGYWKNHRAAWTAAGYSPSQPAGSVFNLGGFPALAGQTLIASLDGGGGPGTAGAAQILLRAAVAAVLNAADPTVDYALTTGEVIAQVNAALASNDRATILALASTLDRHNNAGCPLN